MIVDLTNESEEDEEGPQPAGKRQRVVTHVDLLDSDSSCSVTESEDASEGEDPQAASTGRLAGGAAPVRGGPSQSAAGALTAAAPQGITTAAPLVAAAAPARAGGAPDASGGAGSSGDSDDGGEVEVVAERGQVVTRDLPHPRPDCAVHRFRKLEPRSAGGEAANGAHCAQCYCYVCDVKASECRFWGTGALPQDHANAWHAREWTALRVAARNRRATAPAPRAAPPLPVARRPLSGAPPPSLRSVGSPPILTQRIPRPGGSSSAAAGGGGGCAASSQPMLTQRIPSSAAARGAAAAGSGGGGGAVGTAHWPHGAHWRPHCPNNVFSAGQTSRQNWHHCTLCMCCRCNRPARECRSWGSGTSATDHANLSAPSGPSAAGCAGLGATQLAAAAAAPQQPAGFNPVHVMHQVQWQLQHQQLFGQQAQQPLQLQPSQQQAYWHPQQAQQLQEQQQSLPLGQQQQQQQPGGGVWVQWQPWGGASAPGAGGAADGAAGTSCAGPGPSAAADAAAPGLPFVSADDNDAEFRVFLTTTLLIQRNPANSANSSEKGSAARPSASAAAAAAAEAATAAAATTCEGADTAAGADAKVAAAAAGEGIGGEVGAKAQAGSPPGPGPSERGDGRDRSGAGLVSREEPAAVPTDVAQTADAEVVAGLAVDKAAAGCGGGGAGGSAAGGGGEGGTSGRVRMRVRLPRAFSSIRSRAAPAVQSPGGEQVAPADCHEAAQGVQGSGQAEEAGGAVERGGSANAPWLLLPASPPPLSMLGQTAEQSPGGAALTPEEEVDETGRQQAAELTAQGGLAAAAPRGGKRLHGMELEPQGCSGAAGADGADVAPCAAADTAAGAAVAPSAAICALQGTDGVQAAAAAASEAAGALAAAAAQPAAAVAGAEAAPRRPLRIRLKLPQSMAGSVRDAAAARPHAPPGPAASRELPQ